jgi:pectate lyase
MKMSRYASLGLVAVLLCACATKGRVVAQDPTKPAPLAVEACEGGYPFSAESLWAERVGFGSNATGGDPAQIYRVTTLADSGPGSLREALTSDTPYWIVFDVEGTIRFEEPPKIKSNRTVDGRGRDITIDGGIKLPKSTSNVIFSDVKVTYPRGYRKKKTDTDLFSVYGYGYGSEDPSVYTSRDLWFHHLELTQGNDGAIDLRGVTDVTISWSYIHHHEKAFLMDVDGDHKPTPGMRVTMHHNFLEWVSRRGPKIGWGMLDFFNNYHKNFVEYGVVAREGARVLSESNIFEARPGTVCVGPCRDPNTPDGFSKWTVSKVAIGLRENQGSETDGFVKSRGDWLLNGAQVMVNKPERVFERSDYYQARVDPAGEELRELLVNNAGPRRRYCR